MRLFAELTEINWLKLQGYLIASNKFLYSIIKQNL
jgi:hypothetical protein